MTDLRDIAQLLNGDVVRGQVLAPGPGHSPKDRSLSVRMSRSAPDGFVVYSFAGDDIVACRDHVSERVGIDRRLRRAALRAESSPIPRLDGDAAGARRAAFVGEQIATITRELVPVRGTSGERYLREIRRINTEPIADVLERIDAIGWHPAVFFREEDHPLNGRYLGCIIGVMTDAVTATPTGAISRTYLDNKGGKIGKARTLGRPAGIVRLSPDEDVLGGLILAEGLETALAAMSIGLRPTWASGSASVMRGFPVLSGIESLTILADHDANGGGELAARETEQRWRRAGRDVRIIIRDKLGDFNDALKEDGR